MIDSHRSSDSPLTTFTGTTAHAGIMTTMTATMTAETATTTTSTTTKTIRMTNRKIRAMLTITVIGGRVEGRGDSEDENDNDNGDVDDNKMTVNA